MRLMVKNSYDPSEFDFYVINGEWSGKFKDGHLIKVAKTQQHIPIQIICDNQDRLRGNYKEVINNFKNEQYVGPPDEPNFDNWDNVERVWHSFK